MSTDSWAIDIVEAIREKNENNSTLLHASVFSVEPFTIKLHDQIITKNLYINPSYMVNMSNAFIDMQSNNFIDFLEMFHKKAVINKGDTVIVFQSGVSFFILCKVVKI